MPAGLSGYTLIERWSGAGRGTAVWRARDPIGSPVALKVVTAANEELSEARLRAEGRLLSALGGRRHLVACLGTLEEPFGLVLEIAGDRNLSQQIQRGAAPLPIGEAVDVVLQAADAVGWLHENGVVHRDVKCSNIVLASGPTARLIDLGLAIGRGAGFERSWIDEEVGTLGYCPPELLGDGSADGPTIDVYGLAATLYEAVSGHLPYDFRAGETEAALRARIRAAEPPIPIAARLRVPIGFAEVVDRALAPEPGDRHETVAAFTSALQPFRERF